MGKITISGKLIGVYQESDKFFARFVPDDQDEIDIPITAQQFHGLILKPATITIEIL